MAQQLDSSLIASALENAPLGVLILDKAQRIIWINRTAETMFGGAAESLLGQQQEGVDPLYRSVLFEPEESMHLPSEAGREARWLQAWRQEVAGRDGDAHSVHFYADVTDLQSLVEECDRLNDELARRNTRDPVTSLPNRQALLEGLEPLVSRSRRYHNPLSLIRLRIDNLPDIGARHGSAQVDRTMLALGRMLKDQMRWADLVGRFDQDEFLLVLPETNEEAAHKLVNKLKTRIAALGLTAEGGQAVAVTARFGVVAWEQGDDRARLLRRGREALDGA
ncbi:MAG TPA: sensor domain-containing diguanylate cyclase [Gammaproteobacteria bacterium]|nr:sensor domain-containing diguanylate cyclase [Gammaproteobacteria bacterium]